MSGFVNAFFLIPMMTTMTLGSIQTFMETQVSYSTKSSSSLSVTIS